MAYRKKEGGNRDTASHKVVELPHRQEKKGELRKQAVIITFETFRKLRLLHLENKLKL
jgi:hypothetical protein